MAPRSKVTGARSMFANMRKIMPGMQAPMNLASRKALAPLLSAAKRNAPVDEGDLKKSLAVKRDSRARKNQSRHVVGPRADYMGADGDRPVKYAHVVEFGSADGSKKGTRFLTRAFEESSAEVMRRFGEEIGPALERQIEKIAKKRAKQ
jgi:HK97 gp10 family phage protein